VSTRQFTAPAGIVAGLCALIASTLTLAACAPPGSRGGAPATVAPAATTPAPTPAPTTVGPTGKPRCEPVTRYDRGNFPDSARITNKWLPLAPGTQFTLSGTTNQDGERLPRQVVMTVTDLTKVIDGVRTRVILDRDYTDGQLAEAELAFHAQDQNGNVWGMGEYPEEYEEGRFAGAPSVWITGRDRAEAGNLMPADPAPNRPEYLQGVAPKIGFLDCARVARTNERVCAGSSCRGDVLVVDESSPLEPESGHQLKFHAPGVGVLKVTAVEDPEGETLSLAKTGLLSAGELAKARAAALKLEQHAYQISPVYRGTPPLAPG
jgi:hypothetical protein